MRILITKIYDKVGNFDFEVVFCSLQVACQTISLNSFSQLVKFSLCSEFNDFIFAVEI